MNFADRLPSNLGGQGFTTGNRPGWLSTPSQGFSLHCRMRIDCPWDQTRFLRDHRSFFSAEPCPPTVRVAVGGLFDRQ